VKRKRKPAYLKIIEGMQACYYNEERDCSRCPYDKYNDRDFYQISTAYCMEKLNDDARKWAESMQMFTNCCDCCMWKDGNTDEYIHEAEKEGKSGWCGIWRTTFSPDEYCSRGGMKG